MGVTGRPTPPEVVETILDLRAAGVTQADIARRVGYSETTISNMIKKAALRGDPRAPRPPRRHTDRNTRIFAMYRDGQPTAAIAREFHLSKNTIKSLIERSGVRREPRYTPEQTDRALTMWAEGKRQIDIAREVGMIESQVRYRVLKAYQEGDERVRMRPPPSVRPVEKPEPVPEPVLPDVVAGIRVVRRISPNDGVLIALPYLSVLEADDADR
jgi:DNA-binding CsgD family transcriptional regulator